MTLKKLKGKAEFRPETIKKIEDLLKLRIKAPASEQKSIRKKNRALGFYGQDDWGITDMKVADFHSLIESGLIKIIGGEFKPSSLSSNISKPITNIKPKTNTVLNVLF